VRFNLNPKASQAGQRQALEDDGATHDTGLKSPREQQSRSCRLAGPVPVGVRVEHRFHRFLQPGRGHGLRDSVRDARHPEHAGPSAMRLGDLHRVIRGLSCRSTRLRGES